MSILGRGGFFVRTFQIVMTIITVLMAVGMFFFNMWVASNFSKGLTIPECYMPLNIITTVLIVITAILIFIKQ
jgi:hypothetical protein